jgi:hypothetical protein
LITQPALLKHGDRVMLTNNYLFRFRDPTAPVLPNESSLNYDYALAEMQVT